MGYKVDNAIIMAAGTSSRLAPLSYELPKALIKVKGEILIERQIRQLREAGIKDIYIVVGYKKELFDYLVKLFDVVLVENDSYLTRNNHSSIYAVRMHLKNSYICSADNYFEENPFEREVDDSYYAGVYSEGYTEEWCMSEDDKGYISDVQVGGEHSWYMLGHAFWSEVFSKKYVEKLEGIYDLPETKDLFWENIYINYIRELKMKIRKYPDGYIYEFDTLDELRTFDKSYIDDTRSVILKSIAEKLKCQEKDIAKIETMKGTDLSAIGFSFCAKENRYEYLYEGERMRRL